MIDRFKSAVCQSISIWYVKTNFTEQEKAEVKRLVKEGVLEVTKNLIRIKK